MMDHHIHSHKIQRLAPIECDDLSKKLNEMKTDADVREILQVLAVTLLRCGVFFAWARMSNAIFAARAFAKGATQAIRYEKNMFI